MKRYTDDKEIDRTAKELVDQGWTVRKGKHVVLTHPDKVGFVSLCRTASCHRHIENLKRDIRRVERLAREKKERNEQRV
jgi:hypothetical protein